MPKQAKTEEGNEVFVPGTALLDPETGYIYRARGDFPSLRHDDLLSQEFSIIFTEGSLSRFKGTLPTAVKIIWEPQGV